jgi:tungstate transport system permease protein
LEVEETHRQAEWFFQRPTSIIQHPGKTIDDLLHGLAQALQLLIQGDPELWGIVALSLRVTGTALLISTIVGVPLGAAIGLARFRGKSIVTAALYTGMGIPPVVAGLFVYLFLSRSGPLGSLGWLFTTNAMIAAQVLIALPMMIGLTLIAVMSIDPDLRTQIVALGATRWQTAWTILIEARIGVTAAIVAAFGSIISEVGAVMLVGGNIAGETRVLTTAIVLDTRQGEFGLAMALGIILIAITFAINVLLMKLQGSRLIGFRD